MTDQYQGEPASFTEAEQPLSWAEAKEFTPGKSLESYVENVPDFVPMFGSSAPSFQVQTTSSHPYYKGGPKSPLKVKKPRESKLVASVAEFVPAFAPSFVPASEPPPPPTSTEDYPSLVSNPNVQESKVWGSVQGHEKLRAPPPVVVKPKGLKPPGTTKITIKVTEKPDREGDRTRQQIETEAVAAVDVDVGKDDSLQKSSDTLQVQGTLEHAEEDKTSKTEETKETTDLGPTGTSEKTAESPQDTPTEKQPNVQTPESDPVPDAKPVADDTDLVPVAIEDKAAEGDLKEVQPTVKEEGIKMEQVPEAEEQKGEGVLSAKPLLEESKVAKILQPYVYTKEMILIVKQVRSI